jgi:hypothetical protein
MNTEKEQYKIEIVMTIFLIITGIVLAIVIVMIQIKSKTKAKRKRAMDAIFEDQKIHEIKSLFEALSQLNEGGTDEDTIPAGYGEFGHEATNPIPVNTVMGNMAYLRKLRTLDGEKVQYERIGSTGAPNIDRPIDAYQITNNGQVITTLYISPYNKKNSGRAPKGFKLLN